VTSAVDRYRSTRQLCNQNSTFFAIKKDKVTKSSRIILLTWLWYSIIQTFNIFSNKPFHIICGPIIFLSCWLAKCKNPQWWKIAFDFVCIPTSQTSNMQAARTEFTQMKKSIWNYYLVSSIVLITMNLMIDSQLQKTTKKLLIITYFVS